MCTILKFAPSSSTDDVKKSCGQRRTTGEVVIFPGIRYERSESGAVRATDRDEHSKRDFLVL